MKIIILFIGCVIFGMLASFVYRTVYAPEATPVPTDTRPRVYGTIAPPPSTELTPYLSPLRTPAPTGRTTTVCTTPYNGGQTWNVQTPTCNTYSLP